MEIKEEAKRARLQQRQEKIQNAMAAWEKKKAKAQQKHGEEGMAEWLTKEQEKALAKYTQKKDKKVEQMPETQPPDSDSESWPSTESLKLECSPTCFRQEEEA